MSEKSKLERLNHQMTPESAMTYRSFSHAGIFDQFRMTGRTIERPRNERVT